MTDWWVILEVAQDADKRAIKRAYSKKLKVTRPDGDPVAFQALYEAYQTGLRVASGEHVYFDNEWQDREEPMPSKEPKEPIDWLDDYAPEPSSPKEELGEQDTVHLEALLDQVDDLLKYPLVVHNPDNWSFITADTKLLDDAFRERLASGVIERIVEFESKPLMRGGNPMELSDAVITSLDSVLLFSSQNFWWSDSVDWAKRYHILQRIDGEPQTAEVAPLGGTINFKERKRPRHETSDSGPENGFSPFNLLVLFIWIVIVARWLY